MTDCDAAANRGDLGRAVNARRPGCRGVSGRTAGAAAAPSRTAGRGDDHDGGGRDRVIDGDGGRRGGGVRLDRRRSRLVGTAHRGDRQRRIRCRRRALGSGQGDAGLRPDGRN